MESNEKKGMNPMVMGLVAIVVVAVVAVGAMSMRGETTTTEQVLTPSPTMMVSGTPMAQDSMMENTMQAYKDGTYEVVGTYTSPAGPEEVGVTVTLANNIISDVEVEVLATNAVSKKQQTDFANNYKTQVVGKSIDEVMLTKVSGSSLTPRGFNDAIEKIKTEAAG